MEYVSSNLIGPRLRAVRLGLGLSQTAFAEAVKAVGLDIGEPNACCKRLVQKWESGVHRVPSKQYRHAIERLSGQTFSALCAPTLPEDVTDAAGRVSRLFAALVKLEAELLDLHAFLNRLPESELDSGSRQ